MNRKFIAVVVLAASAGFVGNVMAQSRFDERAHGYNPKVAAAQASAPETRMSKAGGRHDEKPHGIVKPVVAEAPAAKPATPKPGVTG